MARRLFGEGIEAARAERWEEARDKFARAYSLVERPRIALNLGSAQAQTGQLIEAQESYRAFLRTAEDSDAELVEGAQAALEQVESRTPHLTLSIEGLAPSDQVQIDGEDLPRAALGESWPLNPGDHLIEITRRGRALSRQRVVLQESQGARLELAVTSLSARQVAETSVGQGEGPQTGSAEPSERSLLASPWFWVVLVVVVAGAVTAGLLLAPDSQAAHEGNFPPGVLEIP